MPLLKALREPRDKVQGSAHINDMSANKIRSVTFGGDRPNLPICIKNPNSYKRKEKSEKRNNG